MPKKSIHPEIMEALVAEMSETAISHPQLSSEESYMFSFAKVWNQCSTDSEALLMDLGFYGPTGDGTAGPIADAFTAEEEALADELEYYRTQGHYEGDL